MPGIVEENGKALGQAVQDIGNGFCGSIVSILKDIQTIGEDTLKMVKDEPEKGTDGSEFGE